MSNLKTAPKRAADLSHPKSRKHAARLYNDVEHELALGEPTPEDEAAGESALRILEGHHPGIKDEARDVEAPPSLSQRANRNIHDGGRQRRNVPSSRPSTRGETQEGPRKGPARAPAPVRRRAVSSARAAAGGTRHVRRYADRGTELVTGDTATSWGGLALNVVLGGVILSLFYLVLTKAKGTAKLMTGATNVVHAVVSPTVDPLNPTKIGAAR